MACFFIVHHHGGKIEAKSQPARARRSPLRLPLKPEPAAPRKARRNSSKKRC